jgi:hypothetical protein
VAENHWLSSRRYKPRWYKNREKKESEHSSQAESKAVLSSSKAAKFRITESTQASFLSFALLFKSHACIIFDLRLLNIYNCAVIDPIYGMKYSIFFGISFWDLAFRALSSQIRRFWFDFGDLGFRISFLGIFYVDCWICLLLLLFLF